jgi:hypothetical protein
LVGTVETEHGDLEHGWRPLAPMWGGLGGAAADYTAPGAKGWGGGANIPPLVEGRFWENGGGAHWGVTGSRAPDAACVGSEEEELGKDCLNIHIALSYEKP